MAEIIMVCGIVCSGKSTYCKKIKKDLNAVILSGDEIITNILEKDYKSKTREHIVVKKISNYIHKKAKEIALCGTNVILDYGYRSRAERTFFKKTLLEKNINVSLHYVYVSKEQWLKNIEERNKKISLGLSNDVYIPTDWIPYLEQHFEEPFEEEIDVLFENNWN